MCSGVGKPAGAQTLGMVMFKKIGEYLSGVRTEMGKVSWPGREQLIESTGITLALSVVVAVFIFFIDQIISRVINFIL